jgi:hypothetical protein
MPPATGPFQATSWTEETLQSRKYGRLYSTWLLLLCGIQEPQAVPRTASRFRPYVLGLGGAKHRAEDVRADEGDSNMILPYRPLLVPEKRIEANGDPDFSSGQ